MEVHGRIVIKLEKLLEVKGVSKNDICKNCGMQRTQLLHYCRNEVTRVDLSIIAKLCERLDCTVADILEYIPWEKG